MNYLAHAYLSFDDPEILVGNMISDFVKGKKKFDYPVRIQQGIMLHRAIDTFTDQHPVNKTAMQFFKPVYGLYAGAFVDVVYDHFLASNPHIFPLPLDDFAFSTYAILDGYQHSFPARFKTMFPYMKEHNWLGNYKHRWAINRSFQGLVNRATYMTESDSAFSIFENHYASLGKCFDLFFPELESFAFKNFNSLA